MKNKEKNLIKITALIMVLGVALPPYHIQSKERRWYL